MARVTPAEVEEIIEVDATISLTPFITAANELVTELCTDSGYTDARLLEIERWLVCHFYRTRDPAVDTEKAGSVSVKYQYKLGLMLMETEYGQRAMLLDTAGNLAQLSKQLEDGESATVSINWLGEDYDSEDDE